MTRRWPAGEGNEQEVLTGFLDWQRATVALKVAELGDIDSRRCVLDTSPQMTIAGVISHLRQTEHEWFSGSCPSRAAGVVRDPRGGWHLMETPLPTLLSMYEVECQKSRAVIADLPMDAVQEFTPKQFTPVNLRWILTHMIEETARHLGHIDVIREQLDGSRGY